MKAVLLAGGRGTRLAPLTDTCPKPLVRVLDIPVIEYAFATLKKMGITTAAVTTCYRADEMRAVLGDVVHGVDVHYVKEETPLGTAGAVKACEEFLDEDFLVLSADALFDLDLDLALDFFEQHRPLAALVLTERDDVGEYGLVRTDREGRILGFSEKPSWQGVFTNRINCGIYLCRKEILSHLEAGVPTDFSHDLFPRLLSAGEDLRGVCLEGYWCDIGNAAALYDCNMDALYGRIRLPLIPRGRVLQSGATKSFVGEGAVLLGASRIEESIIGAASRVIGAQIRASVIGRGATIESGATVTSSIVGDRLRCEKGAAVSAYSVLGNDVHVAEFARTDEGARVSAGETVTVKEDGFVKPCEHFNGGVFSLQGDISALKREFFALGTALGETVDTLFCGVSQGKLASFAASALCLGAQSRGACVRRADSATEEMTRFVAATSRTPSVFVRAKESALFAEAQLFDENGLSPLSAFCRAVSSRLCQNETGEEKEVGVCLDTGAKTQDAYRTYLAGLLPPLEGKTLTFCESETAKVLSEAARECGAETHVSSMSDGLFFDVDASRLALFVYLDGKLLCDAEHLRAAILLGDREGRKTLFCRAPLAVEVEETLRRRGILIRYPEVYLPRGIDEVERAAAFCDFYLYDLAALCAAGLKYFYSLSKEFDAKTLFGALESLPTFAMQKREYIFEKRDSARLFSRLWDEAEESEGGLLLRHGSGVAHLYPAHGRVRILSEGADAEAAAELCDWTEERLNTTLKSVLRRNE
ncbi:MAG: NDP-sugar synthase [Clostridia bacterium]|nr:NDP-sugar synthase [Clostridia bacterium]